MGATPCTSTAWPVRASNIASISTPCSSVRPPGGVTALTTPRATNAASSASGGVSFGVVGSATGIRVTLPTASPPPTRAIGVYGAAMSRWTASDIPDLTGRVAVVTGANSGLGWQTALELARHGATVIMACRDGHKGAAALGRLRAEAPGAAADVHHLDLADLASVRTFAEEMRGAHDAIDIVVNNAGVMAMPYLQTADGLETQFATNHLGHFALTGRLLPALLARPGGRVVTVSSTAAAFGRMDFEDLQSTRHYLRWAAYAQSKLANQLFAYELARRAGAAGTTLVSVAAHPGYAATNLQAAAPRMAGRRLQAQVMEFGNRLFAQSDADGALPQLYAATAPGVRSGEYYGPDRLFGQRGHPTRVTPPRQARSPEAARRLWAVSEELTGVTYVFGGGDHEVPDHVDHEVGRVHAARDVYVGLASMATGVSRRGSVRLSTS